MPGNDKLAQLHDRLLTQIQALLDSQDWREFIAVAARFHRYSTGVSGTFEVLHGSQARGVVGDAGSGERLVLSGPNGAGRWQAADRMKVQRSRLCRLRSWVL